MLITPYDLTQLHLSNVDVDVDTDRYLRIRYVGRKSDVLSDSFKFQLKHRRPNPPVITVDRTDVTPGFGIVATGSAFDPRVIGDEHLSTDWRVTTDPEGTDVVAITGRPNSPTEVVIDDFIDRPTGDYYVSVRYEGNHGFSDWSEPTQVHWTNWEIPDEYWQNQIAVYDQVWDAYSESFGMNRSSWFTSGRVANLKIDQIQTYDLPLQILTIGATASGSTASITSDSNVIQDMGGIPYADTFSINIKNTTSKPDPFHYNKKGCVLPSATVPNRQYFDLTKTNGKFVTIVNDPKLGEFYFGYRYPGDNYVTRITYCKKTRAVTTRPDVTIPLMVI